ncbi:MAG: QueG-associated DUF1730 domain-containing protein [Elusimicrobiaceae bacterium]
MGIGRDLPQRLLNCALAHADEAGLVRAGSLEGEYPRLLKYIESGLPENLDYLARNPRKRADIRQWYPDAQSVLMALFQYWNGDMDAALTVMDRERWEGLKKIRNARLPKNPPPAPETVKVSRYALSRDYHETVTEKLNLILEDIKRSFPDAQGRVFADSAPVLEKALAASAGLGFQGRNSLLIRPGRGSYFFLGGIALNISLPEDYQPGRPVYQDCGTCRKCETVCPGKALSGGVLNPEKCAAYWNTSHKGNIPQSALDIMRDRVQGCDICQEVCPFNCGVKAGVSEEFRPLRCLS